jgi:hypothetical protein
MIQAPSLIGTNRFLEAEALDLFLEKGLQALRPVVGATPPGIAFGALVHANEDVMCEG